MTIVIVWDFRKQYDYSSNRKKNKLQINFWYHTYNELWVTVTLFYFWWGIKIDLFIIITWLSWHDSFKERFVLKNMIIYYWAYSCVIDIQHYFRLKKQCSEHNKWKQFPSINSELFYVSINWLENLEYIFQRISIFQGQYHTCQVICTENKLRQWSNI